MAYLSRHPRVERARPLLGTLVTISVQGLPEVEAHRAIDRGFEKIAKVHSLMSFHERASDLSQLNRSAHRKSITVHSYTFEVLSRAISLAADTNGVFDPTIGGQLVEWGHLPPPDFSEASDLPDPKATWRDIELMKGNRVQFHRSLWIDLGGIAKGVCRGPRHRSARGRSRRTELCQRRRGSSGPGPIGGADPVEGSARR